MAYYSCVPDRLGVHFTPEWHIMAAFTVLCRRSIMPLAAGWYAIVRNRWALASCSNETKMRDSNCLPWSVVILAGVPNRQIHPSTNARYIVVASISFIGTASAQRENLSITVRQYLNPAHNGNVPIMSIWTWENLFSGATKWDGNPTLWRETFDPWQCKQLTHHSLTFLFILGHT